MLLAIDIGNSAIKFGLFDGSALIKKNRIETHRDAVESTFIGELASERPERVMISSVVPELNDEFLRIFPHARFAGSDSDIGLRIDHDEPETIGSDRIVNVFAAAELFDKPCIVCSLGTAATIDAVTSDSVYRGGTIAPGMRTMAASLNANTSKLPLVEIEKCRSVFGRTTPDSIRSGIYFGMIGMVEGIVGRMKAELGEPAKVIATGGFAELIAAESEIIDIVDPDLLLKGLNLLGQRA